MSEFGQFAINNAGTVAFQAAVRFGVGGLFAGGGLFIGGSGGINQTVIGSRRSP